MRKLSIILLAVLLVFAMSACSQSATSDKMVAYASVYPMYDFLKQIGGEHIDARCIMPTGAEPHDWEPSTQDIINLEQADFFIYNGAGLEHWVDSVLPTLKNKNLVVLDASVGTRLLVGEEHDHDHNDHDGHSHDHDHHEHGSVDPHIWLSIDNARAQTAAIARELAQLDPDNADYYAERLAEYHAELEALDMEYQIRLKDLPRRSIVVAHSAYGYLCYNYGLEQISVRGFSPEQEPDPATMAAVVDFCRENDVKVIFFENAADPRVANAIAAETGATTDILTPIESISQEDMENGENYISLMRRNLEAIVNALS